MYVYIYTHLNDQYMVINIYIMVYKYSIHTYILVSRCVYIYIYIYYLFTSLAGSADTYIYTYISILWSIYIHTHIFAGLYRYIYPSSGLYI